MSENRSERFATAIESTAAAAGAGIGLAVAGPAGALAGAAASPVLASAGHGLAKHLRRRAEAVLTPAVDELGEDKFLALLDHDQGLASLAVRAVAEAGRAGVDAHVRAMADVLRDAAAGEIDLEPAGSLLDTIVSLKPACVVVLRELRDRTSRGDDDYWDEELVETLGLQRGVVRAALATMELTGAVESTGAAFDGGDRWRISETGLATLTYLEESAGGTTDS